MGLGRAWGLVCAALAAGCSYEWDGLRPLPGAALDAMTDAAIDAAQPDVSDARADAVDAPDASDAIDVVDAPDVADALDASDVADASDVSDALDAPDARDVVDVLDAPDVVDVRDVVDVLDVVDAPDVVDVRDVVDVVDVPIDLGTPDTGPMPCPGAPMTCACSTANLGGYCRPGEACMAGACVATTLHGALVITEIMNDPMAVTDDLGEWVEVYNPGATPLDLRGLRIGNSRMESATVMSTPPVVIAPMSYAVFARNGNTATNGGVTALYVYPVTAGVLNFGNSSTDAVILDLGSSATEIDRVTFDGATGSLWPRSSGRAKSLRPTSINATDNDMATNWCNAPNRWSPMMTGDYGSPGAVNPACP